ncbi:MAG TPA: cell division protein FtsB [Steroidobacteraceae bacterium]|nr:cell division protein FtsB [Steroidobacteraceae bacterium]
MKWFIAALAAVVVLMQYRIWVSPDGAREVLRLDRAVAEQRAENERLQARNQQLFAEVKDLKQGFAAVEERARAELGLVAPNETYYQVVPPEDTPAGLVEDAPVADSPTALASAAH